MPEDKWRENLVYDGNEYRMSGQRPKCEKSRKLLYFPMCEKIQVLENKNSTACDIHQGIEKLIIARNKVVGAMCWNFMRNSFFLTKYRLNTEK